ncbi:hypothetical protein EVAR_84339_1 [Eumeta japonica]|uniref:Histone-lysine N-methyltransferase SETMAR n=1 Tax=Eumeta variegata TaxID=151549 RepID=A0A4C1U5T8_EUMVA|nr:hypothetical protein EVAR_84339_1 [Eumeta japonica]
MDETYLHRYGPETNLQSITWKRPSSRTPKKFENSKRVAIIEYLDRGVTATGSLFKGHRFEDDQAEVAAVQKFLGEHTWKLYSPIAGASCINIMFYATALHSTSNVYELQNRKFARCGTPPPLSSREPL